MHLTSLSIRAFRRSVLKAHRPRSKIKTACGRSAVTDHVVDGVVAVVADDAAEVVVAIVARAIARAAVPNAILLEEHLAAAKVRLRRKTHSQIPAVALHSKRHVPLLLRILNRLNRRAARTAHMSCGPQRLWITTGIEVRTSKG